MESKLANQSYLRVLGVANGGHGTLRKDAGRCGAEDSREHRERLWRCEPPGNGLIELCIWLKGVPVGDRKLRIFEFSISLSSVCSPLAHTRDRLQWHRRRARARRRARMHMWQSQNVFESRYKIFAFSPCPDLCELPTLTTRTRQLILPMIAARCRHWHEDAPAHRPRRTGICNIRLIFFITSLSCLVGRIASRSRRRPRRAVRAPGGDRRRQDHTGAQPNPAIGHSVYTRKPMIGLKNLQACS